MLMKRFYGRCKDTFITKEFIDWKDALQAEENMKLQNSMVFSD